MYILIVTAILLFRKKKKNISSSQNILIFTYGLEWKQLSLVLFSCNFFSYLRISISTAVLLFIQMF